MMNLYFQAIKALVEKEILRKDNGTVIKDFSEGMGVAYIKIAQILATQNLDGVFSESDRRALASICDESKPIKFKKIRTIIESEYGCKLEDKFSFVDPTPIGSASMSQVHKAVLKTGETVAIKVKRLDITTNIEKDIELIKKLMHKYGEKFGLKNLIGGDKALDLYLTWIYEESDFAHEKENIKEYKKFADSVNGKVAGTKKIIVPKVYDELCTQNLIVMEHIESKTINQKYKGVTGELSDAEKKEIWEALNSYIQLCFYALINSKEVLFHGDPHGGNIYIDKDGNIGFLDMGLIFKVSKEEGEIIKEFFLSVYNKDENRIFKLILSMSDLSEKEKEEVKKDITEYKNRVNGKPVTAYFSEMIEICVKYNIAPPAFLYTLAKAFVCLFGINTFSENLTSAKELLQKQVREFYVKRSLTDGAQLVKKGASTLGGIISKAIKSGSITDGVKEEEASIQDLKAKCDEAMQGAKEIFGIIKKTTEESPAYQTAKKKVRAFKDVADQFIDTKFPTLKRK